MALIKGKHAVLEALTAPQIDVTQIFLASGLQMTGEVKKIVQIARHHHIPVHTITNAEFKQMVPEGHAQSVAARLKSVPVKDISVLIDNPSDYPFVVALDHIQDPHNFGAIVRTCAAFGVKAVIFPKDRNSGLNATVTKVSSGGIHHVSMIKVTNLAQSLITLKKAGYWVYGSTVKNGTSLEKADVTPPAIIVVGNEQKGMSKRVEGLVDVSYTIPMAGRLDSLNVSVAAGIFIYKLTSEFQK